MRHFAPKLTNDGRALLNVGCGWKMHWSWTNVDFSPYARLATRPRVARFVGALGLLSPTRTERLAKVDPSIVCWDLRAGIPFEDGTFDAVYHSHFVEHLDRLVAPVFLQECFRVLKPAGILRVVVPDWELMTHEYLAALAAWDQGAPGAQERHGRAMYDLIEQMVRVDASGPNAGSVLGKLENRLRGRTHGTGELHKWMYDRRSIMALLESTGFRDMRQERSRTSRIDGWENFGLDLDDAGNDYKAESLYVEGLKSHP